MFKLILGLSLITASAFAKDTKFTFHQPIKITRGFYRGLMGIILEVYIDDCLLRSGRKEDGYLVYSDGHDIKVCESDLEAK